MSRFIEEGPGEETFAFIQWKGTDACLDFTCRKCGYSGHFDGDFAYAFECFGCKTVWEAPAYITYRESQRPEQYGCIQKFDDWECEDSNTGTRPSTER